MTETRRSKTIYFIQTYHSIIKMKPVYVQSSAYIDFGKENNYKDFKFKVSDHARISKYERHFCQSLHSNLV